MEMKKHLRWEWPSKSVNYSLAPFNDDMAELMAKQATDDPDRFATSITTVIHNETNCEYCPETN